jgi:hypothetical protein
MIADKNLRPNKKVLFEFGDDTTADIQTECDHQTFMAWWKQTAAYIRAIASIKPLDENIDPQ